MFKFGGDVLVVVAFAGAGSVLGDVDCICAGVGAAGRLADAAGTSDSQPTTTGKSQPHGGGQHSMGP
jgi:hypothetical protein